MSPNVTSAAELAAGISSADEPIAAAVEVIYYEIRESFELAMRGAGVKPTQMAEVLATVDDAVGNDANFDQLLGHLSAAGVKVGSNE